MTPLFPIPLNETKRLAALKSYGLLDTAHQGEFDALTRLASEICGTPISLISLVDESRQWFKSAHGIAVDETPREHAFCAHAIQQPEETMVVTDLRLDHRFAENPYVAGDPHMVFYAGVPLTDANGFALGTLCVLDVQERVLTEFQLSALRTLANQVVMLMQLHRRLRNLQTVKGMLGERSEELGAALQAVIDAAPALSQASNNLEWLLQNDAINDPAKVRADVQHSLQLMQTVNAAMDNAVTIAI